MIDHDEDLPDNSILYADSNRGVYIPQYFAESVNRAYVTGVEDEDWTILEAGPEHELYWDVWDGMLDSVRITEPVSKTEYYLYHDGDLWLIPTNDHIVYDEEEEED